MAQSNIKVSLRLRWWVRPLIRLIAIASAVLRVKPDGEELRTWLATHGVKTVVEGK